MKTNQNQIIRIYEKTIPVLESDIDDLNHVNNVSYVHWMQDIAIEHSAALGWPSDRYVEVGTSWVVRRHSVDYLNQGYLGDTILAQTWICEMKNVSSTRRYRFIRVSDGKVLAEAETRWGFVCMKTGRLARIPSEMHETFEQCQCEGPDSV